MAEKPKTIFYSLSQALRGDKKDIPSELAKGNSEILSNNPGNEVSNLQNQQQRFADIQTLKTAQDIYTRSMYYDSDRISAYNDYRAMDQSPEIAVALDIMSDECVSRSDRGEIVTVYSEDSRIKREIQKLLTKLNVNYNLKFWIRTLLKYGDNFLKLEIDQHMGVYNITQLPVGEIHKEVGYDGNPYSVRYKWDINNLYFEDFQVAHFSLIADAEKIPYGRSILDPVRKLWKQLQLAEDALLVYRLVRAPERRMFFIDVGNTDTPDVEQYIEKIKAKLKKSQVVDQRTGNINMKFNLITFEEDFFIPVRGDKSGTRVETLPGACLALDTEIHLLDGRTLSLSEIIKEFDSGKKLETYSINPQTGEIVPSIITWAGVTRKNTDVIKITLDNGESIICTPDHKFPTKFNGKKEAKDLIIGESLWSFNKKFEPIRKDKKNKRNNYEQIFDHSINKWVFTHRLVSNFYKLHGVIKEFVFNENYKEKLKNTIHHLNLNRFDNSSENLALMSNIDHYEYHQKLILEYSKIGVETWLKKYNNDENFKKNVIDRLDFIRSEYYNMRNESQLINHNIAISNGLKNYFNSLSKDELFMEMKPLFENKEKARKNLNIKLKNQDFKNDIYKRVSEKSKTTKKKPENKIKYSINSKKLWENEKYKKSVVEKQTIKYSNLMLNFVIDRFKAGKNATEILNDINSTNSEFILEFNSLNKNNLQLSKMKNGFTHNNLYKMMKYFGYDNWRDFKNKVEYYNHKVVSIEFLEKRQDTGTITIDGNELFHDFHNFALKVGVFTSNSNLGDIADVEYLQNKLFTGIKVPKTYLNYGEALPGGSTLSQADLRFARTINGFQEAVVMELRNIVNIHLKILGFDDDINNFTLTLTNPSTQQELLKLETMKARLDVFKDIFSSEATAPVSYSWAMEYILGFSKSEIKQILIQKKIERKMFYEIERAHEEYMDTGIFTKIDKKFRKPDFDPDTQIDTDGEGGGDDSGGGGGFGGFGGGDSFGLGGDTDMPDLDADNTDVGGGEDMADTGADAADTEPEDTNLQENLLLENNKNFDTKTKNLLKGIDSFLHKIKNIDKN